MNTDKQNEQEARRKSAFLTLTSGGAILGLLFLFAFTPPFPPHEAEGFLIDFGFDDSGMGSEQTASSAPAAGGDVVTHDEPVTQDIEETITLPEKRKLPSKNNTSTTNTNTDSKPTINEGELFNKDKNFENNGNSNGDKGGTGDFGDPSGIENGGNGGDGNDGPGGTGDSNVSLAGRKVTYRPQITGSYDEEGLVVIKITVDRNGNVVKAEVDRSQTQITDPNTIAEDIAYAKKYKFDVKSGGPEFQYGTINFNHSRR
ncbi:MAG: energy transducer TonB [Chitinophagales bacterium]